MTRPMVWTVTSTPGTGRPIHVEQATLDHLLGPECDVGDGLVGVGVELGPTGTIARRQSDGADMMMPGRRGARGVDLEPARAVAARLSDRRWDHRSREAAPLPGCLIAA